MVFCLSNHWRAHRRRSRGVNGWGFCCCCYNNVVNSGIFERLVARVEIISIIVVVVVAVILLNLVS